MSLILSYLRESRSLRLQYLSCRSVQLLWHYSQTAIHLICFGRSLHPSHEAGLPPSPRLAGCPLRMHRGSGSRPSSACVDPCGDLCWLDAAAEGAETRLPASQSVSAGGVTRRSAPSQVCGLALLGPGPVDLSSPRWAPPYISRPRQLSQRGRTVPRAKEKSHIGFFTPIMIMHINPRPIVTTCLYTSALLSAELGSCLHP